MEKCKGPGGHHGKPPVPVFSSLPEDLELCVWGGCFSFPYGVVL